MKQPKIIFLFLFLLMCCSAPKVLYDYDSAINFTKFKSFHLFEDVGKGFNEFDVKRTISILETELTKTGLTKQESPDFFINFTSKVTEAQQRNSIGIGIGIGGGGRNSGFRISGGIPIGGKKLNERITIEFISAKTNQLFWQGSLVSTIKEKRKPEERKLYLQKVFQKILSGFPPKK
ncbi:MAG: DUF4136 domain-containing protein [Polaribacter sp.]